MHVQALQTRLEFPLFRDIKMKTSQHERLYYLDWLRLSAFGLLFLFHSWRPFDHMPWHMKSDDQNVIFDILTMFVHGWRMFLIFLVSGAGSSSRVCNA